MIGTKAESKHEWRLIKILIIIFIISSLSYSQTPFIPNSDIVGEKNGSYIDPEFNSRIGQVVFQDMQNRVRLGNIDMQTGLFISQTGKDFLIDVNINPVFDTPPKKWYTNGPEWSKDNLGDFVVYTKEGSRGIIQQWMGRLKNNKVEIIKLKNENYDCYGNMPSRIAE